MDKLSNNRSADHVVPEWARVREVAKIFSVGRSTLYELIRTGAIASRVVKTSKHHVSGIRLISTESVRAFIETSPTSPDREKAGVA